MTQMSFLFITDIQHRISRVLEPSSTQKSRSRFSRHEESQSLIPTTGLCNRGPGLIWATRLFELRAHSRGDDWGEAVVLSIEPKTDRAIGTRLFARETTILRS